jgi:hypothetical protein
MDEKLPQAAFALAAPNNKLATPNVLNMIRAIRFFFQSMVFLLVQPVFRATWSECGGGGRALAMPARRFISPRLTHPATVTYVVFSPALQC